VGEILASGAIALSGREWPKKSYFSGAIPNSRATVPSFSMVAAWVRVMPVGVRL
jgi:hypothetical protein